MRQSHRTWPREAVPLVYTHYLPIPPTAVFNRKINYGPVGQTAFTTMAKYCRCSCARAVVHPSGLRTPLDIRSRCLFLPRLLHIRGSIVDDRCWSVQIPCLAARSSFPRVGSPWRQPPSPCHPLQPSPRSGVWFLGLWRSILLAAARLFPVASAEGASAIPCRDSRRRRRPCFLPRSVLGPLSLHDHGGRQAQLGCTQSHDERILLVQFSGQGLTKSLKVCTITLKDNEPAPLWPLSSSSVASGIGSTPHKK